MNFNYDISLKDETATYSLSGYLPCELIISPKKLTDTASKKIRKIVYEWNDGEIKEIQFKPTFLSNSYTNENLEPLNPKNFDVEKILKPKRENSDVTDFYLKVTLHFFGTTDLKSFNIHFKGYKPNLMGFLSPWNKNYFFEDVFLVDSRMFGPENKLIYVFETKNPNYILMSTVVWENNPVEEKIKILPPTRPYKFLMPFDKVIVKDFLDTEQVEYKKPTDYQNDNGGNLS
jgi:hypothetical protein